MGHDAGGAGSPKALYEERQAARTAAAARLERRDAIIANARLVVFVGAAALAVACWRAGVSWWTMLAPLGMFLGLVVVHALTRSARDRARRAVDYYARGLARLDEKWRGHGDGGERFATPDHPYAADLDLFGPGSVFELLGHAGTVAGRATLAAWLQAPAPAAEVRARQEAVRDLAGRHDLREDLALRAEEVGAALEPERLRAWAAGPSSLPGGWRRALALVASVLSAASLTLWLAGGGARPLLAMIVVALIVHRLTHARVERVVGPITARARNLEALAALLERLEAERALAPPLEAARAALGADGQPAAAAIARLGRRLSLLEAGRNQVLALVAGLFLWDLHCAWALEAWRLGPGQRIGAWLDALGRIEALALLGTYGCERPADPFPELTDDAPRFAAVGLGHPLISDATCVRNDVDLGGELRVLVVSGSNMSGKSTLLRSIGVAVVLGLAGAPVRAHRLTLSPLRLGATLRIQDSLEAGISRFYAEIARLSTIVEAARATPPLLFLLDELLAGTNSHDRRIGAEAVIRALVERGAVGLITTHDLALADIAVALGPRASNVHFEDHLEGGRISFDYTMRPGVVTKSNALALMRAVGLEV